MKFKPVPEPPADLEALERVLRAVPCEAGAVDDCCQHLLEETALSTREDAATWLTFLRALEAAEETGDGFRRRTLEDSLDPGQLRRAFRERIHGSTAVLEILAEADRPLASDEVGRRLADRTKREAATRGTTAGDSTDARVERVERLLEWAVLFDLLEGTDGRYRSR